MQRDPLEDFVRHNRDAFDTEHPGLGTWSQIEKRLDRQPQLRALSSGRHFRYWRIAAAIALLLIAGGIGRELGIRAVQEQQVAMLEQTAPDFEETEAFYQDNIAQAKARLMGYQVDPILEADLEQIDEAMAELRQELAGAPPAERRTLVENLINQYRLKLNLLERILQRLQDAEAKKNNKNDSATRSI
jgi:hypothetical protein